MTYRRTMRLGWTIAALLSLIAVGAQWAMKLGFDPYRLLVGAGLR